MCKKNDNVKENETARLAYKELTDAGLCNKCGNELDVPGRKRCSKCADKALKNCQQTRDFRIANNICTTCGKEKLVSTPSELCQPCRDYRRAEAVKAKTEAFNGYGGVRCNCPDCPYHSLGYHVDLFQIDHCRNDGNLERKTNRTRPGITFYKELIRKGFPEGYQVLCTCCNFAKSLNGGMCPHEHMRLGTALFQAAKIQANFQALYSFKSGSIVQAKADVFNGYGGIRCACESCPYHQPGQHIDFFQLDHTKNNGRAERKKLKELGLPVCGEAFYRSLTKACFPEGYQVLCAACNFAKGLKHNGGMCVHEHERLLSISLEGGIVEEYEDMCVRNYSEDDLSDTAVDLIEI